MFKKILPLSLCLIAITVLAWQSHRVNAGTLPTGNTGSFAGPEAADEPHPFIRYGANQEFRLDLSDGAETADANGVKWKLGVESAAIAGQPDAKDYCLTWTMTTGQSDSTSVGVVFEFNDWSPENFVMVPAAVYDGNRFDIKHIGYPPYWYNPNEWRIDMPTTMTQWNPTLGQGPDGGRIHRDLRWVLYNR